MARYFTLHSPACLTRQGVEELAAKLLAGKSVRAVRVAADLIEGKMVVEFEAPARDALARWLEQLRIHYDLILRVEVDLTSP